MKYICSGEAEGKVFCPVTSETKQTTALDEKQEGWGYNNK